MTRTLTVYKFVSPDDDATVSVLMSALEVTRVEVVVREIVSFFIISFDEYDDLKEEEIAFLQEHFDGYYIVENRVAIEIYNGVKEEKIKERIRKMKPISNKFGELIAEALQRKDLGIKAFSKSANIRYATMFSYATSRRLPRDISMVRHIATSLDIDQQVLIDVWEGH